MEIQVIKKEVEVNVQTNSIIAYKVGKNSTEWYYAIVMEAMSDNGKRNYQVNRLGDSSLLIKPQLSIDLLVLALNKDNYIVKWEAIPAKNVMINIEHAFKK